MLVVAPCVHRGPPRFPVSSLLTSACPFPACDSLQRTGKEAYTACMGKFGKFQVSPTTFPASATLLPCVSTP